jgi:hypothetical protein
MAKRKSKRISTANQAAPSFQTYRYPKPKITPSFHTSPYPKPKTFIEPPPSRVVKLVLDAFNKAGITFDPKNEVDAQWLFVIETKYATYDHGPDLWPSQKIQDAKSRLVTERLLSALREVGSAILLVEKEAERNDIPVLKQNVALRVREELLQLQTIWRDPSDFDHTHLQWMQNFVGMIRDLEWSAARALEKGIHAPHGKSKTLAQYTFFVRGLYDLWAAKTSQIGVYKSGGRYIGPFVEIVERSEELLPSELKPPSAEARGKRVARAIGVHKRAKPS